MLRRSALAALIASAASVASCGSPADLGPFTIRLVFDTSAGGCATDECEMFGMSCGARLSVRIIEADTGSVLARTCAPISASDSACDLGNLPPSTSTLFDLPPKMLRIEVAAWSQATLDADPTLAGNCPDDDIFDLKGIPLTTFTPQPAFAGAAFFDAGSSESAAIIPLACTDPLQLDTAECAPPTTQLATEVLDIERLREAEVDAANLLVRAAFPRTRIVDDQTGETETLIDTAGSFVLTRDNLGTADFSAQINESVSGSFCSLVLEEAAQATTTVICTDQAPGAEEVVLDSSFLSKAILDELLAAAGLLSFPEEGLLVGRVFDQTNGTAVAGVSVLPVGLDPALVQYLNSSRTGTIGDRTLDNGYFIATGVPFDTDWTVSGAAPMVPTKPLRGGLVRGNVTILTVPLTGP